ncbi:MAG TPA: thiopurine S-methyltransferase [Halioglobus sp.]
MEAGFWHQKWERGETGFHEKEANLLLIHHFEKLHAEADGRVFLPLCGKTRDIAWLLAGGYRVVGAELSALATKELFRELDLQPEISTAGKLTCYSARNIDILVGDIFDVSAGDLGTVNALYDRAALVALPAGVRGQYASHLINITGAAPQLLVTLEYDQQGLAGPPFSVDENEIQRRYGATYQCQCVESYAVAGGLKGKVAATESAWLLRQATK